MTKQDTSPKLDPLLHQPVRTRIAAFLAARGETTFSELKKALEISDGNLDSHMKKLVSSDYIIVRKVEGKGRPQSFYSLSEKGSAAFKAYVTALQAMLGL